MYECIGDFLLKFIQARDLMYTLDTSITCIFYCRNV